MVAGLSGYDTVAVGSGGMLTRPAKPIQVNE